MQFDYVLKPTRLEMLTVGPTESEAQAVDAHVRHLEELKASGLVLMAGRTQTADMETFGLVLLDCANQGEAKAVMLQDPAVQARVMSAKLYPFQVAIVSEQILGGS